MSPPTLAMSPSVFWSSGRKFFAGWPGRVQAQTDRTILVTVKEFGPSVIGMIGDGNVRSLGTRSRRFFISSL